MEEIVVNATAARVKNTTTPPIPVLKIPARETGFGEVRRITPDRSTPRLIRKKRERREMKIALPFFDNRAIPNLIFAISLPIMT